jgi:mono/diheme cytochrome c family protein
MRIRRRSVVVSLIASALLAASHGCAPVSSGDRLSAAAERGRDAFAAFCASCHNLRDPFAAGINGPAVAGASAELLHAKVVLGEDLPGREPPPWPTKMPAQPVLAERIPDLAAFLAEVQSPKSAK